MIDLRLQRRWGADRIGIGLDWRSSTVQGILNEAGLGRLDRGDRATDTVRPIQRYQRETPGELIHVDIKKIAEIPQEGGWRTRGRATQARSPRSVGPATDSSTSPSTTEAASPTPRPTTTSRQPPPPDSGADSPPGAEPVPIAGHYRQRHCAVACRDTNSGLVDQAVQPKSQSPMRTTAAHKA